MTSPIETAAEKIRFALLDTLGGCNLNVPPVAAKAAFDSIDTDELRDEIAGWPIGSGYYGTQIGTDEARDIARAVKNWLTGKDQP